MVALLTQLTMKTQFNSSDLHQASQTAEQPALACLKNCVKNLHFFHIQLACPGLCTHTHTLVQLQLDDIPIFTSILQRKQRALKKDKRTKFQIKATQNSLVHLLL